MSCHVFIVSIVVEVPEEIIVCNLNAPCVENESDKFEDSEYLHKLLL